MSNRDDVPAAEHNSEGQHEHLTEELEEGATPGAVGALDGTAAVGSLGALSTGGRDSEIPQGPPDPTIGPD